MQWYSVVGGAALAGPGGASHTAGLVENEAWKGGKKGVEAEKEGNRGQREGKERRKEENVVVRQREWERHTVPGCWLS